MPRLDTLLVVHTVHEKSRWKHVPCRDAWDALVNASGSEPGAQLPSTIRGELVLNVFQSCGLSVERTLVSRRLLSSIVVDLRDDTNGSTQSSVGPNLLTNNAVVSLSRFAALIALQCGGDFDEKLRVMFVAADRDGVGRLTQDQTVKIFASDAAPVVKSAANSVGDRGSLTWIVETWRDVVSTHFVGGSTSSARNASFVDFPTFNKLASSAIDLLSERAVHEDEEEGEHTTGRYTAIADRRDVSHARNKSLELGGGHHRSSSGPQSSTAAGIADVLASFAGAGSHGGSRDGGRDDPHSGGMGHHRRKSSYESAHGDFASANTSSGNEPQSVTRASRHRRAHTVDHGGSSGMTPGRPGPRSKTPGPRTKTSGGVIWQMFDSFRTGYTKGRSKTAGNELELGFDSKRDTSFLSPGRVSVKRSDSANRLSPIDSPMSPSPIVGDDDSSRRGKINRSTSEQLMRLETKSGSPSGALTNTGSDASLDDDDSDEDEDMYEDEQNGSRYRHSPVNLTKSDREREALRVSLQLAQENTEKAEGEQTDENGAEFETAIAFAQEVGVRLFLYNIVKMLLVIALIAADASICVWTMFHFGIVIGLSVVMVINIGLALLFGFFVIRYTERERGMMHMEYGQHAFKGVSDIFAENNIKGLGESLAIVTSQMQEQHAHGDGRNRGANQVAEDVV